MLQSMGHKESAQQLNNNSTLCASECETDAAGKLYTTRDCSAAPRYDKSGLSHCLGS